MRVADATIVIWSCFGLLTSTNYVLADGAVGCLFSNTLCKPKTEWCYNDFAFGKCVSLYEGEAEADLYQYDFNEDSFYLLRRELEKLIKLGYRWSHFYTQCVLKALLFAFRYQKEYDESLCEALSEEDPALTYFRQNPEIDRQNLGQVQFTPSVLDPHAEYADEIYLPEFGKNDMIGETIVPLASMKSDPSENYVSDIRRALLLSKINKNKRSKEKNRFEIIEEDEMGNELPADYAFYLNELANEEESGKKFPFAGYMEPIKAKIHFTETYNTPDHFRAGLESRDYDRDDDLSVSESIFDNDRKILNSFSRNYNTPEKFRNGHETKDEIFYPKINSMISADQPDGYFYPEERQLAYDQFNPMDPMETIKNMPNSDGVYTEGGVMYLNEEEKEPSEPRSLEELMNTYENWGFKRPERLDVKKPGPSFSTNNYAFQIEKENEKNKNIKGWQNKSQAIQDNLNSKSKSPPRLKESIKIQPEKKKGGSPMESPILRKITTTVQPVKEKEVVDEGGADDNEFAYITLKNKINTWQEGSRVIRKIENVLRLSQNTFSDIKVSQNEVNFKVEKNRLHLNASEIAKRINANRDAIQRLTGVEITNVQVGNQTSLPSSKNLLEGDERQLWILSFLLCGVIAAVAIAGTAFFVIRRHTHHKEKIKNLAQMDSEASKDYQELCRARMAAKAVVEKPEGNVTGHKITNIVKETEAPNHSPSSRSSTSSWSEEPALTNMDISTGHMVLSYMEDHLKNKDRLEQEWIALCAYEAEPSATTIAMKGENAKKNRYNDVLPYDHARVLLNELSNISGSDYINASTITDHDPRNPAYIVTQGPLQNTSADFWQMVWEQGSVVMVMLTRLTENGNSLCHRYWPEEGSELYHIYEVHLVSEHIWCDDYLVRSFYLKNIKTGETRTVTQFHFLSWPENGIPLSTKALLEFRRKVNKSYRGRSCPIVVHCSDGAGRSGTYCLIDMVLNRMSKGAKEIDIAATLEHIRDQRAAMVRTKQQFEFVLMAVAEEVHAILKALPANPNHSPPPVAKE